MAIYYFMIMVLTGLGYVLTEGKKQKKSAILYLAVVFFCLTLFASFRYAIGFDYFSYRSIYETISERTFGDILHSYWYEPLFFVVCKVFSLLGCSFPVFLLWINCFLFFVAMRFICRYSKLPWVSVYLFITLQFLAYDMNLIRQSISVSFFLLAHPYLKNRKIVPFTILILIGGLFHNSLLFIWLFYFLLPGINLRKFIIIPIGITVLGYFLFDPLFRLFQPLLPERYAGYFGSYFWNSNSFVYVMPSVLYGLLIYLFRNRISEPAERSIYLNSALYNFLISLFITKHYILERFSIYPFALSLIAIPEIISSYRVEKDCKGKYNFGYPHVLLLFLLFGGAYFFFAVAKGYHNVYPYVSLLNRSYSVPH